MSNQLQMVLLGSAPLLGTRPILGLGRFAYPRETS
jgi:hypothetical protein